MSDIESLKFQLKNLQKLHLDLEKQMVKFDEIIPYERQTTAKIFSPRLLNMILVCGPQIESVTRLIANRCNIPLDDAIDDSGTKQPKSIPRLIHEINSKSVLSKFKIISRAHNLLFSPFVERLEWWQKYNDLKHGLGTKQFEINYTVVMDALAGLSTLYCLADKLMIHHDNEVPEILDAKNWVDDEYFVKIANLDKNRTMNPIWKSLLFGINSFYKPY